MENHENANLVKTVADLTKHYIQPHVFEVQNSEPGRAQLLAVPDGLNIKPVLQFTEAYADKPMRRKGKATLFDLESFVAHVNRFKDTDTVLFGCDDPGNPSITAVLNYHIAGAESEPRFGDHRAYYDLPKSDEWKAWEDKNGIPMSQIEFAEFLEDRIVDVYAVDGHTLLSERIAKFKELIQGEFASPNRLMTLSVGLSVTSDEKVTNAVNLQTGEAKVSYSSEHKDEQGKAVDVPKMFMIGIPVFRGGVHYQIAVRLRYRVRAGSIHWFYEMYQADRVFDDAIKASCKDAAAATELPLLMGQPEE